MQISFVTIFWFNSDSEVIITSNMYCLFIQIKSDNPPKASLSIYRDYGAIASIKRVIV